MGLAAKAAAPRTSLGTLFLAAQFTGLLWPTLLLLGVESVEIGPGITRVTPLDFVHYPISHSLSAVLGWAFLFALVYHLVRRNRIGALLLGATVASPWVLDAFAGITGSHNPSLSSGIRYFRRDWNFFP